MERVTKQLDTLYPTLVRYAGLGIMGYTAIVHQLDRPSLIVAAGGMILFKTIKGSGDSNSKKPKVEELEEK
jgi:hypothetical protein